MLYPIFIICATLCSDNSWKNVFYNLSEGITPKGVKLDKEKLWCRNSFIKYTEIDESDLYKQAYDIRK